MTRPRTRAPWALLLTALVLAAGCRQSTEIPPRYAGSKDALPAPILSNAAAKGFLGAAATGEEPAKPVAERETAVQIDDSSPDAVARSFADMVSKGDFRSLPAIAVQDQQDAVNALVAAIQPLAEAVAHFREVAKAKFADAPVQISLPGGLDDLMQNWSVSQVTHEPQDAPTATATLQSPDGKTLALELQNAEGHWKVHFPAVPEVDADEAGQLATALGTVASRIEAGEIQEAQAVVPAIEEARAGAPEEPAAQDTNAGTSHNEPEPTPEPQPRPRRERTDVDDVAPTTGVLPRG